MTSRIRIYLCLVFIAAAFAKEAKIIGGTNTFIEECPYLVSLRRTLDDEHMCAGAIIGHRYILTAAHCLHESYAILSELRIHLGASDTSGREGMWFLPEKYFLDPRYNSEINGRLDHQLDIAIIRTYGYIEFNEFQNKVDLPTRIIFEGDFGTISGWGATTYPSNLASNILQKTWMTVINSHHCRNIIPFHIFNDQFCAYQRKNVGPCIGDGGSPLVSQDNKIIGILTVSVPCATGIPDLYTSVYSHLPFIRSIIEQE